MDIQSSYQSPPTINWHFLSITDSIEKLKSQLKGLSNEEANQRLQQFGLNVLKDKQVTSPFMLFISQFTSLLIIILIIAGIISAIIGNGVEAIAIIIIVILAGVLGFLQEYKAGKAIESLRKMAAPYATVVRDGKENSIPASNIVPGDIILLKTGYKIPADARLIEVMNLKIDEASLTGESESVQKTVTPLPQSDTLLSDRVNMIYMGTVVSYGRGKAIVTETGMSTEFGKIADLLQATESRKTPLQDDLDKVGRILGIFSIVIAAIISVFGILRGYAIVEMFIWGIALAVAVIPEALPAVVTISLALGVRRMVKRRALIRKLAAVETLGATTIICSDKTGTLTQDEMTIRKIFTNGRLIDISGVGYKPQGMFSIDGVDIDPKQDRDLSNLFYAGVLCSDTVLQQNGDEWEVLGDPTEGGVIVAAMKAGIERDEIMNLFPRVNEIPFTSERKRMTTIHKFDKGLHAFSKGAPEVVLGTCSYVYRDGKSVPLTDAERKEIINNGYRMGEDALRVLGFAEKLLDADDTIDACVEHDMVFLGLVGMIDPPRPEAKQAIKLCELSGIKPVMITGDHKITAVAVARELGILKQGGVITGTELEHISDEELEQRVESINVYARIAPVHKMRIVTAFINRGHVVAMTGDGVNDAPSLKKADIGVAMGITGTDVSKEAADMILTDDNFASIVAAIEEGRSIFENIRKYLIFLLSGNMATVFAMICALVFMLPLPLTAVQILFINFIMDGLIAIALGVEPPEPGIMRKKPRNVHEGILNPRTLWSIGNIGIWIALVTVCVFVWELSNGYSTQHAVTVFFATLILSRLFNGINCRSMEDSIFKIGLFTNKPLLYSTVIVLLLTSVVIYFPPLQKPFSTIPLSAREVIIALLASSTVLIMAEIQKFLRRRKIPISR
jgi:P-type Ca2+ transporter type 2C